MADAYPLTTDHLSADHAPTLVIMMMMIIADLHFSFFFFNISKSYIFQNIVNETHFAAPAA